MILSQVSSWEFASVSNPMASLYPLKFLYSREIGTVCLFQSKKIKCEMHVTDDEPSLGGSR